MNDAERLAAIRAGYTAEAIRLERDRHGALTTRIPNELAKRIALRDQRGPCILAPFGWWCRLWQGHDGPCPADPAWWNVRARRRIRQADRLR